MSLPPPDPASTALITGASSGMGAELARGLARRGHGVTLVARREDRLKELADELHQRHGVRAETASADVSDPESRRALKADVEGRGLTVEVLVNSAGFGSGGAFTTLDPEEEAAMVRTNVEGLVALTGHFVPGMRTRGRGAVLNLASLIAFQPVPFQSTYGATKVAVLHFSESLHEELRGTGVSVTAICPGPVRTEFGAQGGFGGADEKIPDPVWLDPDKVAEEALKGAEKGNRVVVPGVLNRVTSQVGRTSPRWLSLPVARRVWPVE